MKQIRFIIIAVLLLSVSSAFAECDFMAMLAKNGSQISQFPTEADSFLKFQEVRSSATAQNDGYGIVYYKNGEYSVPFDYTDPLNENNQAYHLFGEFNHSWYQHHGPSGQTEFPQPEFPGYYWNDSKYQSEHPSRPDYEWIDIEGIGTEVTFTHNDEAVGPFNIGFNFEFYGDNSNQFIINPNGWIGFGDDNTAYLNSSLPDTNAPKAAVFGFWDDLDPLQGGNVYYHSDENRLIVWFDSVIHYPGAYNGTYDFQIILFNDGKIKIQYRSVSGDTNSGTIGIQNANGTQGLQVVYDTNFTNEDSYVENELAVLFSTEAYPEPLDIAEERIMISNNNAIIVLGHDRDRADPISSDAVSQHPFRFVWNDKTYTFQHNGYHDYKEAMRYYCLQQDSNWFNIHPLNWEIYGSTIEDLSTVNDTEILFHYIMAHIIEYEGDVVGGIISALNEEAVYDDVNDIYLNFNDLFQDDVTNKINITLSDGEALYVFRNTGINGNSYNLSYKDYANGFVGVKTQGTIPTGTQIQQFSLVKIPRNGEIVTYENIFDLDAKLFTSCYNWISYPRLTEQGTSNGYLFEQAYFANNEPGMFQLTSGGDPTINDFDIIYGHRLGAEDGMDIVYNEITGEFSDHYFNNMLHRHEGYKVKVASGADPTILIVDGDRLPSNYELSDEILESNKYHWLGYWLPYSQDVDTAFGKGQGDDDFWQHVKVVKAENWTWMDMTYPRGTGNSEPKPSMKIRPLEYGKGYLVKFSEDVNDFHWNDTNVVSEPERKEVAENFTYKEKADYEVIDILEIDPIVTEIGVFEDGVCVGAVAVQDSSVQILVYSDNANRDPVPFTFEITTSRGSSIPIKCYNTLNLQTGEYENKLIISGRQEYSVVKFGKQMEPNITISTIKLNGNYPNPFNPTTTISFSLPTDQEIELTVFNIKGQKVKTLYSGIAEEGKHTMIWEGKDTNDKTVSSGIYFYKLKTNNKELTRKMILMK